MMDEYDLDGVEEPREGPRSVYKAANWRPRIGKRLLERAKLLAAWLRITVLPQYGWHALGSMLLITAGRLADAASFVVGIHILTGSMAGADIASSNVQLGLAWAAAGLAGVLAVGSILGYLGNRSAARLVLEYESTCVVEGLSIVRHHQKSGLELSRAEIANITRQAPRLMSRSLLHIINACTACALTLIGLVACIKIFPALTGIVLLSLLLMSPLYVYAAVHSTNIGHSIRLSAPGYGNTMRRLQRRWLSGERKFNSSRVTEEMQGDADYKAYQEAYGARLTLSARNNLLSNLTLAFIVAISFMWIAHEVELSTSAIAAVVSYLVSLRLFAHGLAGIFHGIQRINTALPLYLFFLMLDPRLAKAI